MFEYRYPQFQSKRLLRAEMLDELRDYPLRFTELMWQDWAQGVAAGCRISWAQGVLTVGSGIIYKNKRFYLMAEPYSMDCGPLDQIRYLKVKILPEHKSPGEIAGVGEIVLEERQPDDAFELDLCRFRLQEGARLRARHENFEDFSTEYDTVDFTYAPWAGKITSTLNPMVLARFAKEMLRLPQRGLEDVSFCLDILSTGGKICGEAVREYIRLKTGLRPEPGIRPMYEGLLGILKEQPEKSGNLSGKRDVLLI